MREGQKPLARPAVRVGCAVLTSAVLFALAPAAVAKPQPGDLDRSFSGNGVVFTKISHRSSYANAVAIGRKRRIVVAGWNERRFALARYKPNGHLDHSLSHDGRVVTAFPGAGTWFAGAYDVAIGHKGSIVVAGDACPTPVQCDFAVARYRADGRLDKSFGDGGRVTVSFPGYETSFARAVAITSGGGVLVGGTACPHRSSSGCDFALARLDRRGRLDPAFGSGDLAANDGRVTTQFTDKNGDPIYSAATGMAVDSRDRIVLGGSASGIALARYKANGHLVRKFGHDGKVDKVPRHHFFGDVSAIAMDAKHRIVVAGSVYSLARFGRNGRLDRSFGKRGQVSTDVGNGHPSAMAIDSRDRIVVAGSPHFTLVRYQPNGKVNRSFGVRGKVRKDFGNGSPHGLAIDSRDRPVAAGYVKRRAHQVFAVARFLG